MAGSNTSDATASTVASTQSSVARTRTLLACGTVAGPLFVLVVAAQMLTRDGFDITRHPLSLLSLGELGWIQVTNFVVSGTLFVAAAVGMRRAMVEGTGATWGPRLIGLFGSCLVWAGVFVADPADGFPGRHSAWHGRPDLARDRTQCRPCLGLRCPERGMFRRRPPVRPAPPAPVGCLLRSHRTGVVRA